MIPYDTIQYDIYEMVWYEFTVDRKADDVASGDGLRQIFFRFNPCRAHVRWLDSGCGKGPWREGKHFQLKTDQQWCYNAIHQILRRKDKSTLNGQKRQRPIFVRINEVHA